VFFALFVSGLHAFDFALDTGKVAECARDQDIALISGGGGGNGDGLHQLFIWSALSDLSPPTTPLKATIYKSR
jgi:hypothetical protein